MVRNIYILNMLSLQFETMHSPCSPHIWCFGRYQLAQMVWYNFIVFLMLYRIIDAQFCFNILKSWGWVYSSSSHKIVDDLTIGICYAL